MSDKIDDICRDFLFLLDNQTFQTDCYNLEQLLKISEIDGWCYLIIVKTTFIIELGYWGPVCVYLFKYNGGLFC